MQSVTIRIPKRKKGSDAVVEMFRWGGSAATVTAKTSILAVDLDSPSRRTTFRASSWTSAVLREGRKSTNIRQSSK
jgi:hypothetical protein